MDYTKEKELQRIHGTETYFHGYCHEELIRGIITLQSFVRAENARNMASRTLQTRHRAVLLLQSVTQGWLSQRHLEFTEKNDSRRQEGKRVLKIEGAVQNKNEENNGLRMKIAQFEKTVAAT